MNVNLNGLRPGQWRHLTDKEMVEINDAISGSFKTEEGSIDTNKKPKTPNTQLSAPDTFKSKSKPRARKKGTLSLKSNTKTVKHRQN